MRKSLFNSILTGAMALSLVTACAEDSKDTGSANNANTKEAVAAEASNSGSQGGSVMDQPVNFSTPEDVEKTMQHIRENDGTEAYGQVKTAMSYILTYDLGLRHNEEKMYEKLNGKTPNEIIAQMKR